MEATFPKEHRPRSGYRTILCGGVTLRKQMAEKVPRKISPYHQALMDEAQARRDTYIEVLKETRDTDLARMAVNASERVVRGWSDAHPEFRIARTSVTGHRYRRKHRISMDERLLDGFPGFLDWREMCCAYLDHRTKKVIAARNNWYQISAYEKLASCNRLIVVLPPGHLKTTLFSIEYPTWRIMTDRNVRITAVQKNEQEAKKLVAAVKERLSSAEYYQWLAEQMINDDRPPVIDPLERWFPDEPFRPNVRASGDRWGAQAFRVQGMTSGEKDNTMEAKGVGGQIQGVRADLIILDDVQDPQLAWKSPADADDKLSWFQNVILGRVTEAQQVVVLGNYFAPDDFVHKLIAAQPGFEVVEYPAIITDEEGTESPLCPEYWTIPALEQKKVEVGEQTWFYTWMQTAGSFDEATFKREVLLEARRSDVPVGEVPHGVTDLFLGVDPAISVSGYCAMVLWGLDRKTKQR